jgi:hypothetical protein
MTERELVSADTATVAPAAVTVLGRRRVRPVVVWAVAGGVCTVFALYVYVSWIGSGQAVTVPAGPDPVPGYTEIWAWIFQLAGPLLAFALLVHVVRGCVRRRALCLDAMIVIGSVLAWWHDPLINWLRPAVLYNATLVNFGSWTERIPGWLSPGSRFLPEPPLTERLRTLLIWVLAPGNSHGRRPRYRGGRAPTGEKVRRLVKERPVDVIAERVLRQALMIGLAYVWMPLGLGMIATWAMCRARARSPRLGAVGTFCAGWLAVFLVEILLEIVAVRSGLVAYPAAIPGLTLWAGSTHQLPIYGPLLWSMVLTSVGALRFFRDRNDRGFLDRGVERLPRGWVRPVARALAVAGFIHVVAIVGYDLPINLTGLYAGPTAAFPSYLNAPLRSDQ